MIMKSKIEKFNELRKKGNELYEEFNESLNYLDSDSKASFQVLATLMINELHLNKVLFEIVIDTLRLADNQLQDDLQPILDLFKENPLDVR